MGLGPPNILRDPRTPVGTNEAQKRVFFDVSEDVLMSFLRGRRRA